MNDNTDALIQGMVDMWRNWVGDIAARAEASADEAHAVVAEAGALIRAEITESIANLEGKVDAANASASSAGTSEASAAKSAAAAAKSESNAAASARQSAEQHARTVEDARAAASNVAQQVALDIRDGAPAHMDTLRELAEWASQNDDAMAALTAQIATKVTGDYPIVIRSGLPEDSGPRNEITFWIGGEG